MEKERQLKKFMQIGIIVRDLETAVKEWEARGVGPWDIGVMGNQFPPFTDLKIDGKELADDTILIKTAMVTAYGFQIELIEPVADSAFKRWLDEHGPGVHHMAFDTAGDYNKLLSDTKEQTGKEPWIRGQGCGGRMDFSYLDLREEMGIIMECYGNLIPGSPAVPYDTKAEVVPGHVG